MDPDYARVYRSLYERHWWFRAREAFLLSFVERLRPPDQTWSILDVGCGDGLLFDELSRFGQVEGVESDGSIVDPAGRWASQIRVQPFEAFEPGHTYSLITLLDVLEHVADPEPFLRHAIDLLEPTGAAIVTVPAFRALWTSHDDLNAHVNRFSRASLNDLAERAGAHIVTSRYFFHWVAPLKLAARAKESILGSRPRPPQTPARWLNGALYALSRLEQQSLSRLPIPFGSSLLTVLRRGDTPPIAVREAR